MGKVFYTVSRGKRRDRYLHAPLLFQGKLAWEGSGVQHDILQLAAMFGIRAETAKRAFSRDVIHKKDWDESEHPREPAGAEAGKGGQFTHAAHTGTTATPGEIDKLTEQMHALEKPSSAFTAEEHAEDPFKPQEKKWLVVYHDQKGTLLGAKTGLTADEAAATHSHLTNGGASATIYQDTDVYLEHMGQPHQKYAIFIKDTDGNITSVLYGGFGDVNAAIEEHGQDRVTYEFNAHYDENAKAPSASTESVGTDIAAPAFDPNNFGEGKGRFSVNIYDKDDNLVETRQVNSMPEFNTIDTEAHTNGGHASYDENKPIGYENMPYVVWEYNGGYQGERFFATQGEAQAHVGAYEGAASVQQNPDYAGPKPEAEPEPEPEKATGGQWPYGDENKPGEEPEQKGPDWEGVPKEELGLRYDNPENAKYSINEVGQDPDGNTIVVATHYFDEYYQAQEFRQEFNETGIPEGMEEKPTWLQSVHTHSPMTESYLGTKVSEDGKWHVSLTDANGEKGEAVFDTDQEAHDYITQMNATENMFGVKAALSAAPEYDPHRDYADDPWNHPEADSPHEEAYEWAGKGEGDELPNGQKSNYTYVSEKDPDSADYEPYYDYKDEPWESPEAPSSDSDHYEKTYSGGGMYGGKWEYNSSLDPNSDDYEYPEDEDDDDYRDTSGSGSHLYDITEPAWDDFSSEERDALNDYTGSYSGSMNSDMAEGRENWRVDLVTAALDRSPIDEDTQLWAAASLHNFTDVDGNRLGVKGDFPRYMDPAHLQRFVGSTLTYKAFMSTSDEFSVSKGFMDSNRTMFRIEATEGFKGMYLAGGRGMHSHESEVLLQRNTTFVITGVESTRGETVVNLRIVIGSQTDAEAAVEEAEKADLQVAAKVLTNLEAIIKADWNESKHPRVASGEHGGEFTSTGLTLEQVREEAKKQGYDPEKVTLFHDKQYFTVDGKQFQYSGWAKLETGEIGIWSGTPLHELGELMAHEIMHQQWQQVQEAQSDELRRAMLDKRGVTSPSGKFLKGVLAPSGMVRDEFKAEYPFIAKLEPVLSRYQLLKDQDGVTEYSTEYWKAVDNMTGTTDSAYHETLAEWARLYHAFQGDMSKLSISRNASLWGELFRAVKSLYHEHLAK